MPDLSTCSETWTIATEDVTAFADLTGDHNPLHTDEVYARASVFGERVAHGVLGLSVAAGLLNRTRLTAGTLVAFVGLEWDFVAPIRLGTEVVLRIGVAEARATSRPDRGLVTLALKLESNAGVVLQEGRFKLLVRTRGTSRPGVGSEGRGDKG